MIKLITILTTLCISCLFAKEPINILVITVDDMNADSIGAFGCKIPNTTPHLDNFAKESMRFQYAHVHASSCIPSRNMVQTGRYLWNSGVEGFYALPKEKVTYQTTPQFLQQQGYFTMIRGKAHHSSPYHPYPAWDICFDDELKDEKENIRSTQTFFDYTLKGIKAAKESQKPFYFSMDIHDPHTPFYNWLKKENKPGLNKQDIDNPPSKVFAPNEITVPKFLPDTPKVRQEVAAYYSTVRRADDSFGQVIRALKKENVYNNTLIIFFSDHGMPLPFAKTALFYHSTRTPLMVRWPGVTQNGFIDQQHMIGTIDIYPTLAEIIQQPAPKGLDGRSFASILKGQSQHNRDYVFTMYEENVGGNRQPMRSIISRDYGYIYSPWSDGIRKFSTATKGTASYQELQHLAKQSNPIAKDRLELFTYSKKEMLFHYTNDPNALTNLVSNIEHQPILSTLKTELSEWMKKHQDPLHPFFNSTEPPEAWLSYLKKLDRESKKRKNNPTYSRNSKS